MKTLPLALFAGLMFAGSAHALYVQEFALSYTPNSRVNGIITINYREGFNVINATNGSLETMTLFLPFGGQSSTFISGGVVLADDMNFGYTPVTGSFQLGAIGFWHEFHVDFSKWAEIRYNPAGDSTPYGEALWVKALRPAYSVPDGSATCSLMLGSLALLGAAAGKWKR